MDGCEKLSLLSSSSAALGYCRVGGSAKSNDTSRMDVSQRGTQRSSIKSGFGQPPAKQRPDSYQTAPVGFPSSLKVCEFGSSGWSRSPRPEELGHGSRA